MKLAPFTTTDRKALRTAVNIAITYEYELISSAQEQKEFGRQSADDRAQIRTSKAAIKRYEALLIRLA